MLTSYDGRAARPLALAGLLLAASLLAASTPAPPEAAEVQTLLPGPPVERPIATGEKHLYRVDVTEPPLLLTVEQQSIDLVVEVQGPAGEGLSVDTGGSRWGPEVVLLDTPGERRIAVRPKETTAWPGHYAIGLEAVEEGSARQQALALASRAGREAAAGTLDAWKQAAASYREALAAWRALGERRWEAETLSCLALLEQLANEPRPAIADYEQALALWRDLGEPWREAVTLNALGINRMSTGDSAGARQALDAALALWQQLGTRLDEAETRTNLCLLEQTTGSLLAALDCYEEPRAIFHEAGYQSAEQAVLNNLGGIYDLLGEPEAALEKYEQALALRRILGDKRLEAQSLNNIAVIHRTLGDWQEALRLYGQAREILEPLGERALTAAVLNNVGSIYTNLGEPQRALVFLDAALKLRREMGDRRSEALVLNNLGSAWRKLGEPKKALDHHQQALALAVARGDARQEATIRVYLGELQLEQGDASAALREVAPALAAVKKAGLRYVEQQARVLEGRALVRAGRSREALPVLEDALAQRRTLRDRAGEAEALHALAVAERSSGLAEKARAHAEAAVARAEELRTGFVSPDLRTAFLATQRRSYSLLLDLLMDRHAAEPAGGWDRTAFAVSEQARARSLLDALHAGSSGPSPGAVPAALRDRRQSLRRRLTAKADQQLKQGAARAEALGQEIEILRAELDSVDAEIGRADPQSAAFRQPRPIGPDEITALLDPGTLLLEYALGEERSFLWVAGAGGLRSFVLPPQREIEALARQVHEELSTVEAGAANRGKAAEALGRMLLGQVWSAAEQASRLVIVPDNALHYVPFSALPVPGGDHRPLLEHAEVVYLPSATTLTLERERLGHRPPASKWAAILADPVFSAGDPRLARASLAARPAAREDPTRGTGAGALLPAFERLPSSRQEAEKIKGLATAGQVWTALDLDANREAVLSGGLRAYRIVHFATHGIANTKNPELSGLVLSQVDAAGHPREAFLGLADIYGLDLNADLVVLSGCSTAIGREVGGEGLMGLTRGFLHAGVPRVVASLWAVQDRTTTELMIRFYRAMWQDHLPPAAALRQAQRSLRQDPRYRDPYSWAGFVLQGDWR